MALVSTHRALADAHVAWEAGFSIIASRLNRLLAVHALSIKAAPPGAVATLRQCQHAFLDGLRRSLVPLPQAEILPWSLGFINDSTNAEYLIGRTSNGPDQELDFVVNFLRDRHWSKIEWDNLIVSAIECHAHKWRQWFESHSDNGETNFSSITDGTVLPSVAWADDDLSGANTAAIQSAWQAIDLIKLAKSQIHQNDTSDDGLKAMVCCAEKLLQGEQIAREKVKPVAAELIRVRQIIGKSSPVYCGFTDAFAVGAVCTFAKSVLYAYFVPIERGSRIIVRVKDLDDGMRTELATRRTVLAAFDPPQIEVIRRDVAEEIGWAIFRRANGESHHTNSATKSTSRETVSGNTTIRNSREKPIAPPPLRAVESRFLTRGHGLLLPPNAKIAPRELLLGELVKAIDDLIALVDSLSNKQLASEYEQTELKKLESLDVAIGARIQSEGFDVPRVQYSEGHSPWGVCGIPSYTARIGHTLKSFDGAKSVTRFVATDNWRQAMLSLREMARIANAPKDGPSLLAHQSPTIESTEPSVRAVAAQQEDAELHWQRVAEAVGDENTGKILAIAQDRSMSADRKMIEIIKIDVRFSGRDSNDWATLLRVTAAAIRQTPTWKSLQAAKQRSD